MSVFTDIFYVQQRLCLIYLSMVSDCFIGLIQHFINTAIFGQSYGKLKGERVLACLMSYCTALGMGGHFLYRTVQGCAAGIGVLFMPEIRYQFYHTII